ncbi:MAG: hypothetical protein ABIH04_01610 [Planctomycetota bacterium]
MSLNLKEKKKAPAAIMQNGFADLSHVSVSRWFICYAAIAVLAVLLVFIVPRSDRPLIYCFIVLSAFTSFTPGNVTIVVSLLSNPATVPGWLIYLLGAFVDTSGWERNDFFLVAVICAAGTTIANLNDYHLLVPVFRVRKVRKFGNTLFYRKAKKWFDQTPFLILLVCNFFPLPVSIVRWFAVTRAYPRWRVALAGFLGRMPRYWITAALFGAFKPNWWQTLLFCIVIALIPVIIMRIKGRAPQTKGEKATGTPTEADE